MRLGSDIPKRLGNDSSNNVDGAGSGFGRDRDWFGCT